MQRDFAAYHGAARDPATRSGRLRTYLTGYGHGRSDAWRHERSKAC